ncbi:leucine-rich repeat domain-containing protein [Kineosporia succinea]|uniref:Uncharacterized protein n=1 Tax=Kineosporia succinea TaxID=84632 RepID=A0ABT9PCA7_9ACTN|nr:leucine-rich repeat domain-containing protein [Kineosporia succinea]MDP9830131.1 hypothetical protein [Kineosporia succinea]
MSSPVATEQAPQAPPARLGWFTTLTVLVLGAGIALAAVLWQFTHQAGVTMLAVMLVCCAAPWLVVVTKTHRALDWILAGTVLIVLGAYLTHRWDALRILRLDFGLDQVVTNLARVMAPAGLSAVGVGLVLGGIALRTGDRVLASLATVYAVVLSGGYGLALIAGALNPLLYRGGEAMRPLAAAGVLVALATTLVPAAVVVRRASTVKKPGTERDIPRGPARNLLGTGATRPAVLLTVLALAAGGGFWTYQRLGSRITPADLFPDPGLAACVAQNLDLDDANGKATERQLNSLFSLDCNGNTATGGIVRSLTGLEHLPNLGTLDLQSNEISDLTPLAKAPGLTGLRLTNNQVQDLTPLTALTQLRSLGLSHNQVRDLYPLAGLTSLTDLGLSSNRITDLSPLSTLTQMTELDAGENGITDVTPLASATSLGRLTLRGNQVSDVRALTALPSLRMLDIANNRMTRANSLERLPTVDELWLGGNPVTDLRPLTRMPKLLGVDLEGSDPARLTGVDELREKNVYVGGFA